VAKKIEEYQQKLNQLTQQRNTLSSEIQYMTLQINLTALKIQETEEKIVSTQKEIEILTSRIKGLDTALNHLSKLLLKKWISLLLTERFAPRWGRRAGKSVCRMIERRHWPPSRRFTKQH